MQAVKLKYHPFHLFMEKVVKKYPSLPIGTYAMVLFAGYTMIQSLNSGITWKIIFSVTGFVGLLGLAIALTNHFYNRMAEGQHLS